METYDENIRNGICPICGTELINESGCKHCLCCGWSACDN